MNIFINNFPPLLRSNPLYLLGFALKVLLQVTPYIILIIGIFIGQFADFQYVTQNVENQLFSDFEPVYFSPFLITLKTSDLPHFNARTV